MTKSKIVIAVSLVAALAIGWQLNEVVSAKSTPQKVCLTAFGTLAKRTSCLAGETELASGKVRSKGIAKKVMRNGKTRLASPSSVTTKNATALGTDPEQPLVATLGSSVRSYTYVLGFPNNWNGTITTSCSDTEVALDGHVTMFLDGKRLPTQQKAGSWTAEQWGQYVEYTPLPGESAKVLDIYANRLWTMNNFTVQITPMSAAESPMPETVPIPAGLSVYVTQLCAPLTTLENAG